MAQRVTIQDWISVAVGVAVGIGVGAALWNKYRPCPTTACDCSSQTPVPVVIVPTTDTMLPQTPGHIYDVPDGVGIYDVPVEGLRRIPKKVVQTCDLFGHCSPAVVGRSFDSPPAPIYTPNLVMQEDKYDRYGCYTPGGFRWCDPLKRCVRPWEQPCA